MPTIAAALAERIEDLALDLTGERPTSRLRGELRFRRKGSLSVAVSGLKRGHWYDHEAGDGGDALGLVAHLRRCPMRDAARWAADWLGAAATAPAAPVQHMPRAACPGAANDHGRRNRAMAADIWRAAVAPAGTLAAAYLRSRFLALPDDAADVIRFHPSCPRGPERLSAMVALMTDPLTCEPIGIHRTYLRPDGAGKAAPGLNGEGAKMMLGAAGVIRLVGDADVTIGLGIAEGIETSLAVMQHAGWRPVWATGSAGGIRTFPVLRGIECLTIFPDRDDKGTSLAAANACAERWGGTGTHVAIYMPPHGKDWHDALMREAA